MKIVEIPADDLLVITAVIDHAIEEKTNRNDQSHMGTYKKVANWLHSGKYPLINKEENENRS